MKKILFSIFLLLPAIAINAQQFPKMPETQRLKMLEHPNKKVDIVLDTDTYNEIDDQFALVYALLSKESINIKAVYAAPFSNKRSTDPGDGMEKSYEEILRILKKMNVSPENFAFKGCSDYLKEKNKPQESEAARDLVKKAKQYTPENPLYVVAVGAITNVSSAILMDPEIIKNIVVVWLGGPAHHWSSAYEFNLQQDLFASQLIFDCGVPFVQFPCTPIVSLFATTVPEMEAYLTGRGEIAEYLLEIFKDYHKDHFAWSKVLWDMTAIAWFMDESWTPTNIVHSPVLTNSYTYSFDNSRHMIKYVYFIKRDPIFADFFTKIENIE